MNMLECQAIACFKCAVEFHVPTSLYTARKRDGASFWCPNGHEQHFCETNEARLSKQVERLQTQNANLLNAVESERSVRKTAERSAAATRGLMTKAKNRIAKGVCPCCNRYFKELHRHMQDKHADYIAPTPKS